MADGREKQTAYALSGFLRFEESLLRPRKNAKSFGEHRNGASPVHAAHR